MGIAGLQISLELRSWTPPVFRRLVLGPPLSSGGSFLDLNVVRYRNMNRLQPASEAFQPHKSISCGRGTSKDILTKYQHATYIPADWFDTLLVPM